MYQRRSRLSRRTQERLIEHFVADTTARAAAQLVGVHRNTAAAYCTRLRHVIAEEMENMVPVDGEVEVDESYFGGVRKGRRGRGAAGKIAVFGLLKRGGRVYTVPVPDVRAVTLTPLVTQWVKPDSIVYTDGFLSYDPLDVADFRHVRINHAENFAVGRGHINGIEHFWSQAKRHLRRFNGIPPDRFYGFLKECEWRFNGGDHEELRKQLKRWVLRRQQRR